MKEKVSEKHKDKFYLFHNAHNYTTATCFDLKDEIQFLIPRGNLVGYRTGASRGARNPPIREIEGEIYMIVEG